MNWKKIGIALTMYGFIPPLVMILALLAFTSMSLAPDPRALFILAWGVLAATAFGVTTYRHHFHSGETYSLAREISFALAASAFLTNIMGILGIGILILNARDDNSD
jgi:fatty-acid desaturase